MNSNINIVTFCDVQGVSDLDRLTLVKQHKNSGEKLYADWHEALKDDFAIGEIKEFKTIDEINDRPKIEIPEEVDDEVDDEVGDEVGDEIDDESEDSDEVEDKPTKKVVEKKANNKK